MRGRARGNTMRPNEVRKWTKIVSVWPHAQSEEWTLRCGDMNQTFPVRVKTGKPIDIESIKKRHPFSKEIKNSLTTKEYFEAFGEMIEVTHCPVCGSDLSFETPVVTIWGKRFTQCEYCSHASCEIFPTEASNNAFYTKKEIGDDYYIQEDEIELRINEIYMPKAQWVVDCYIDVFGRPPRSVLDMGAGAGHFLAAVKSLGIETAGVEINPNQREWGNEHFDVNIVPDVNALDQEFDVVCSFNMIEHLFSPTDLLDQYRDHLSDAGMAIVETPKYNSITSALQKIYPEWVRGHMVPYYHNHLFTEMSLMSLCVEKGLSPTHLWYFGQDTVELALQAANELGMDNGGGLAGTLMAGLQGTFDESRLSDLILLAATVTN